MELLVLFLLFALIFWPNLFDTLLELLPKLLVTLLELLPKLRAVHALFLIIICLTILVGRADPWKK